MDEEGVLDFLTSLEAMDLPDRIEEVNAKILAKIIEETDYVAVLFCKYISKCPNRTPIYDLNELPFATIARSIEHKNDRLI